MSTLKQVKNAGDLSVDQLLALVNKLGGPEKAKAVLRGEQEILLQVASRLLVNKHGRLIPRGLKTKVPDVYLDLWFEQPVMATETDYANRLLRLHGKLGINTGITAGQFKSKVENLLAELAGNPRVSNLMNGIWLPVVLPKLEARTTGADVETMVKAMGKSYQEAFTDRKFYNHCQGEFVKSASVAPESRYNQLIKARRQGPVVAIHLPNTMQEFSVQAAREQIVFMPKEFALSGTDIPVAGIMYPEILFRDSDTPALKLAALNWYSAEDSFGVGVDDESQALRFNNIGTVTSALTSATASSCGLVFFRECQSNAI